MFEFLKRLFPQSTVPLPVPDTPLEPPPLSARVIGERDVSPSEIAMTSRLAGDAAVHRYFELSAIIERAKEDGDFVSAVRAARETYPLMPAVVRQMKRETGGFDLRISHAVHSASVLMAVIGDREGIRELREALGTTAELLDWLPAAEEAQADVALVEAIMAAIVAQPGIKQSELKRRVSGDGRRLGTLAAWLEKGKRLRRINQGSTYLLYPADSPLSAPVSDPTPPVEGIRSIIAPVHWHARSPCVHCARSLAACGNSRENM
jgi:hypothetical protein